MNDKIVINLEKAMPASNDCLPHAAMNLGAPRGVGLKPVAGGMVTRLVIEPSMGAWVFHRLDAHGGFVGDSWHGTFEDAVHQAKREFDVDVK
jgi:hypothetical protein